MQADPRPQCCSEWCVCWAVPEPLITDLKRGRHGMESKLLLLFVRTILYLLILVLFMSFDSFFKLFVAIVSYNFSKVFPMDCS